MLIRDIIIVILFVVCIASVYLVELVLVCSAIIRQFRRKKGMNLLWRRPVIVLHIVAFTGLLCLVYGCFIEPYRLEVNTHKIYTKKLERASFKIVQISDLHCDPKQRNERKLVKIINENEPDIIVFTGDSINSPGGLDLFKTTLNSIKAKMGKLAVRGNTDLCYRSDVHLFEGTGFKVLDEQSVTFEKKGEKMTVTGLQCENESKLDETLEGVPEGRFNIFLYHYPGLIERLENLNVDLYLCGHTHGGQIALPFYGALVTFSRFGKKYEAGIYQVGQTVLYVNRGVGMDDGIAPRVRFLVRPEVAVFEIKPSIEDLSGKPKSE